ncbi:MAG TPA: lysylphosphatidylglycerol synthase domain-containing protein [Gammaproteobacteria bacterium]|nr:lysylphosphatidylglycerol synthase domain-containing protein [Gammaproteobacteria bacterium]
MSFPRLGWREAAYLVLVAGAAVLIVVRWSELAAIWRAHGVTFAAVTALMALAIVVQARTFKSFLQRNDGPGLPAMSGVWAVGVLVNYLGPFQPGLAVRVALLARMGVPVADASIATVRQIFASLWLGLLVAGISMLGLGSAKLAIPAVCALGAFAAVSQALPLLRSVVARTLGKTRASALARHAENAIALPTVPSAVGVLSQYVFSAAVFYLGYRQFGVEITLPAALGLACVVYASSIVALFPGNFGVLEALVTGFGRVNELPVDQALALAFLFRGANIAGALLLAAALFPHKRTAT